MNKDDIFSKLAEEDEDEFDIFLDTLKEVFEDKKEKGNNKYE